MKKHLVWLTLALLGVISVIDFIVGFEVSFLVFYCVPLVLAVTALGWRFGVLTAILSVAAWLMGDIAAGAHYTHPWVLIWNAFVAIGTYFLVILLFHSVLLLNAEMENRVAQRTAALTREISRREQLEREVLETTERERRAIGHDLHDGVGQHLTGTAFAAEVLADKLRERHLPEQADALAIAQLIERAIEQTRRLAKGLLLAEIQRDGLVSALQELAAGTQEQFGTACELIVGGEVRLPESGIATQLFRIAQEAVRNAVRHGKPHRIEILLTQEAAQLELTVQDDGSGYKKGLGSDTGLGLDIMAHRAKMIGATFSISDYNSVGTEVTCHLKLANA